MGLLEKRTDPSTGKENQRPTRSGRSASVLYVKEPVLASVPSSKEPSLSPVAKALLDAFIDKAYGSDSAPTYEPRKGLAAALRALADLTEYPWVVDCETLYIHPDEVRSIAFALEQFNG